MGPSAEYAATRVCGRIFECDWPDWVDREECGEDDDSDILEKDCRDSSGEEE